MNGLSFDPIGDSFLIPLLVAVVLGGVGVWGLKSVAVGAARRRVLAALRLGLVLLLTAAMLRPSCTRTFAKRQSAALDILLDQSRSMTLPQAIGEQSRFEAQLDVLRQCESLLAQLGKELEVNIYAYDSQLHPLEVTADGRIDFPRAADGSQTDIGAALDGAMKNERGKRLAAMILLGDGAQTAFDPRIEMQQAGRELARRGVPLYTAALGPEGDAAQSKDIAVENLPDQYSVFVKNELVIKGAVRLRGYVNKAIPVELVIEDSAGQKKTLGPISKSVKENNRLVDVQFVYAPGQPGQYKLTLRVEPQPGELVVKNNELSAFLTVFEGGLKVLYLEGEMRFEQKFLRRSINASRDIDLDFQWIDHRRRQRWPLDLSPLLERGEYDVIILGDLDASALYKADVQEKNLNLLTEAVANGKGLIMLGGYHSFGPGGYALTPLKHVLPILMGRFERQDFDQPIVADLHWKGPLQATPSEEHFLTQLAAPAENDTLWRGLPPLDGANRFTDIKDRARVLLKTTTGKPLLVSGEFGRGRVLTFAADSTWRWWMQGRKEEHKRFWRQIVLWLARRDDLIKNDVWVKLTQRRFNPGAQIRFTAGANTAAGDPILDASLSAVLVTPKGERQPIRLTRSGEHFQGVVEKAHQPGPYEIQVTATRQGDRLGPNIGRAAARLEVFDADVELSNPAARHDQLARLAAMTKAEGGRSIALEELPNLLQQILEKPPELEIKKPVTWYLGKTWLDAMLFFLTLMGVLIAEWVLRKKWSLV